MMQLQNNYGFTLIEAMITVLILAILSSAAIPAYREFVNNQRIKTTAFDFLAMLTLARSEAIKRNTQVTAIATNGNWANGWTLNIGTTSAGTILSQQDAKRGLIVQCMNTPPTTASCTNITYNSNGRSPNSQYIQIGNNSGNNVRCINIDLSGRPSSKKGSC